MGAMIGVATIGLASDWQMARPTERLGAAIDLDFAAGRYRWNGRTFASLDAFLAAIGGAVVNGIVTFPWTDASVQIEAEALVPQDPTGNEVLYSLDDGSENNCLRVRRDSASQVVRVFAIAGGTTLSDIGTLAVGRGAVLKTSQSARSQNFAGAANGTGSGVTIAATTLPAVTTMRIGRGASASLPWSGTLRRITIYPEPAASIAFNIAASRPTHDLWMEGDSYVAGANGIGLAAAIARLGGLTPLDDSIGSSTLQQTLARILASRGPGRDLPLIHWDGDNNGFGTLAEDMARYDQIVMALGHRRFLLLPPTPRSGQNSDQREAARQLSLALGELYGDQMVDPMPTLIALAGPGDADNVANGTVPASLLQDGTHLNRVGMDAVAQLVIGRLHAMGWA